MTVSEQIVFAVLQAQGVREPREAEDWNLYVMLTQNKIDRLIVGMQRTVSRKPWWKFWSRN